MTNLSIPLCYSTENGDLGVSSVGCLSDSVTQGSKNPLWLGLGVRLSQVRDAQQRTAKELGLAAGLSINAVAQIEDGYATPFIETVERIAAALGVSPGWLAFGPFGDEPFRQKRTRPPRPPKMPEGAAHHRDYKQRHQHCCERLRNTRAALGLSMRAAANAAAISVQTWSNAEAGTTVPRIDIVERMAVALDVAPAWLAYGDDEPGQAS